MTRSAHSLLALIVLVAMPAVTVGQGRASEVTVPAEYQPPAGMCRIWVNGVPPEQQPAPTDCATALKNNPANGRVIFGPSKDTTRAGGVSDLLRSRTAGQLPVPGLRAPLLPSRGTGRGATATSARDSAAKRDSVAKAAAAAKRDSTSKRDTISKRDSIPSAAR